MQDWLTMSAAALGRGIAAGNIDPVALTQTYLNAIDAHPLRDRIFARVTHSRALAEAAAAKVRADQGRRLSPLDGVPISWKDLFDTAGIITEAGSALLKDRTPGADAEVLTNAAHMGLVCLGKTHMSELAFSGLGYNPVTETTPCVNDLDAVSGGSSSGAAGSVAFNISPAAIGSDTGGSVRIPAVWNDLVGLKTTAGRVSVAGTVPLCSSFDTIGPLTRSVEDAALLLAALEGRAPADLKGATLAGAKFAALRTVAMDDVEDAPLGAFNSALAKLEAAGAEITWIDAPEVATGMAQSAVLFTSEAYGQWRDVIEANPDLMFGEILERFRAGGSFSAPDYLVAWRVLEQARKDWAARVKGYDAVLCPTSPMLPPNIERLATDHDYYVERNLKALRNTRIGNMMGLCVLTLPTGTPSCGISLMGAPNCEEALLRIGTAAEAALS